MELRILIIVLLKDLKEKKERKGTRDFSGGPKVVKTMLPLQGRFHPGQELRSHMPYVIC